MIKLCISLQKGAICIDYYMHPQSLQGRGLGLAVAGLGLTQTCGLPTKMVTQLQQYR